MIVSRHARPRGPDMAPRDRTAIGARYEFTLVTGDPPVSALLPVAQSTMGTYDTATVPTLTQALVEWSEREQPATESGAWAFRVSFHSSVDPSLQRPVLQLQPPPVRALGRLDPRWRVDGPCTRGTIDPPERADVHVTSYSAACP